MRLIGGGGYADTPTPIKPMERAAEANTLCLSFCIRLGSDPGLLGRGHGELGSDNLQGDQPAGGERVLASGKTSGCLCRGTRARSSGR